MGVCQKFCVIYIVNMRKNLTVKQSVFIVELLSNGGNKVQAALRAYNTTSYKTASKIADSNCNNQLIRDKIERELADHNINAETIATLISEGLGARLTAYDETIKSYRQLEYPDYNVRHKFLSTVIDILGLRPAGR